MFGDVAHQPVVQRADAFVARIFQHDSESDVLPVQGIVVREGAGIYRSFEPLDNCVEVAGVNLHAAFVDLFALASAQVEVAALIEQTDVAGHEPALADHRVRQIVPAEVAFHQCGRVEPDVARFARGAFRGCARRVLGARRLEDLDHRPPADTDQAVLGNEVGHGRASDPTPRLGDAVRIAYVAGAGPALNFPPQEHCQRRRTAKHALQRLFAGRLGRLERHAPHGRHGRHERDLVLVEQRAELHYQVGFERRDDEQILPREPREQTVADQPVPEVGRQQAEGAAEIPQIQILPQPHPARAQGTMRVHHALRLSGCSRGE